jgi:cellulose synthase/poly-beta-1,6-N-acetylglucosamine synthase-like glycosyltransferase
MATNTSHHPPTVVVVPTYNEAQTIRPTIDALLHHTSTLGADVLVVDDGSPDGTGALVSAHPQYGTSVYLLSRPASSASATPIAPASRGPSRRGTPSSCRWMPTAPTRPIGSR